MATDPTPQVTTIDYSKIREILERMTPEQREEAARHFIAAIESVAAYHAALERYMRPDDELLHRRFTI